MIHSEACTGNDLGHFSKPRTKRGEGGGGGIDSYKQAEKDPTHVLYFIYGSKVEKEKRKEIVVQAGIKPNHL